jgi:hypothetical protein
MFLQLIFLVTFVSAETSSIFCSGDLVRNNLYERQLFLPLSEELDGVGGTIQSPNFPDNYNHNTDCSFLIVPFPGNSVTLRFTAFHVDYNHGGNSCYDWVEVDPPIKNKSRFCGYTLSMSPGMQNDNITYIRLHWV